MRTRAHRSSYEYLRAVIRRPVATALLAVAVAISGMIAFKELPVASLPEVDFATITVAATLPGASPDVMASSVATPLERQFGRIAGVTQMTSSSTLGISSITLQFDLSRNVDGAARDVESAINAARSYLSTNLPSNPTYRKIYSAVAPIMVLDLTSDVNDQGAMYDTASSVIQQKISQIPGVGQVQVVGSSLPAVRIDVNPQQLNSYGLGLQDIASTISQQNSNRPKGQLSNQTTTMDTHYETPTPGKWVRGPVGDRHDLSNDAVTAGSFNLNLSNNNKPATIFVACKGVTAGSPVLELRFVVPQFQGYDPSSMGLVATLLMGNRRFDTPFETCPSSGLIYLILKMNPAEAAYLASAGNIVRSGLGFMFMPNMWCAVITADTPAEDSILDAPLHACHVPVPEHEKPVANVTPQQTRRLQLAQVTLGSTIDQVKSALGPGFQYVYQTDPRRNDISFLAAVQAEKGYGLTFINGALAGFNSSNPMLQAVSRCRRTW